MDFLLLFTLAQNFFLLFLDLKSSNPWRLLFKGMLVWHFEIENFSSCATMYFPVLHKFGCQDWEGEVLKHGFSWQCNIYATPQNSLHC